MTVCAKKHVHLTRDAAEQLLADIDRRLDQLLPVEGERDVVGAAMREGALAPGKRIRPMLLLLTARDLGCAVSHDGLLDLACAVEMVHAASLILDDMPCMDDAKLRRGRPTIHCHYGEHVAILAAVALLSKAFGVIADADGLTPLAKNRAVSELSNAIGMQGLVQGQFKDLSEGDKPRSAEAILMTNHFKTSTLFCASMQMASIVANASSEARDCLHRFSLDLGQAFQLLDDLTDGMTDTGKDSNQDAGKSTLVNLLGPRAVEERLRQHLHLASEHLSAACQNGHATQHFIQAWFDKKLAAVS
ncbi:Geranylgeranyl diphosphate synthase [Pantoea ananatis]|uniref:polyprenyl synthetase family protein n=1 Tax=Pantoea ananas TaxID=553 RepID=UPI001981C413|nr:polyprenyl synthetase family protein [Pantoea ananatis]MBN6032598.1 polyprenyl synthetase family protein [Pantoea ananatis]MCK0555738.1 polyprenyl synthetase family protein [Pantoea ananatis]MCW0318926.1 Geranylgeranyl diphosphate synthase [Pantoea ananatis]MCW0337121.1 Geranylgeranyl diphosphate synthase [Pantoea ananatis]MCW0385241.1 Geranylgeranyl diphosphate synthase [Pantoea ananatis]